MFRNFWKFLGIFEANCWKLVRDSGKFGSFGRIRISDHCLRGNLELAIFLGMLIENVNLELDDRWWWWSFAVCSVEHQNYQEKICLLLVCIKNVQAVYLFYFLAKLMLIFIETETWIHIYYFNLNSFNFINYVCMIAMVFKENNLGWFENSFEP